MAGILELTADVRVLQPVGRESALPPAFGSFHFCFKFLPKNVICSVNKSLNSSKVSARPKDLIDPFLQKLYFLPKIMSFVGVVSDPPLRWRYQSARTLSIALKQIF